MGGSALTRVASNPLSNELAGTETIKVATSQGDSISVTSSKGLGVPIVLIHDGRSSSRQFEALLNSPLGRQFRVICPDLPGHGASSKALFPARVYTIAGLGDVVAEVMTKLKVPLAVFVGSGLGAQIAMGAAAKLGDKAAGFMLCDLELAGGAGAAAAIDPAFPAGLMRPISDSEFGSIGGLINRMPGAVGVIGASCSPELARSLDPGSLWRSSVQVVPQTQGSVALSQPAALSALVKAYVADLVAAAPAPEVEVNVLASSGSASKLKPQTSDWANEQKALNPNFGGRVAPGTMPHPAARFEVAGPDAEGLGPDVTADHFQGMSVTQNPNHRGRTIGGTMPHPAARFDFVQDQHSDHFTSFGTVDPGATNPANPNHRGRIVGGTMPHPAARFDYVPDAKSPDPVGMNSIGNLPERNTNADHFGTHNQVNPNLKGRVVGGTMPHPNARFDFAPEDEPVHHVSADHFGHTAGATALRDNPNSRGRMLAGSMPHPSARFDYHPESPTQGNVFNTGPTTSGVVDPRHRAAQMRRADTFSFG